jgi:glycosyltransferase involved in cell wall biosynthesis
MLSWESPHSIGIGRVGVHVTEIAATLERTGHEVHVVTRMAARQPHYSRIDGVHHYRCPFELPPNFVDEINNMCRSFVHHVFQTEDYIDPPDAIHAHDWLAGNALIWIKQGRGRKTVLTIHSTEYGRCGNLLVEAIPAVLKFYPDAKFVAGDGEMRTHAQNRATCLGIQHATRFLGFQANGNLTSLKKACDVVYVPSRNEPFGIVLLEACCLRQSLRQHRIRSGRRGITTFPGPHRRNPLGGTDYD